MPNDLICEFCGTEGKLFVHDGGLSVGHFCTKAGLWALKSLVTVNYGKLKRICTEDKTQFRFPTA